MALRSTELHNSASQLRELAPVRRSVRELDESVRLAATRIEALEARLQRLREREAGERGMGPSLDGSMSLASPSESIPEVNGCQGSRSERK